MPDDAAETEDRTCRACALLLVGQEEHLRCATCQSWFHKDAECAGDDWTDAKDWSCAQCVCAECGQTNGLRLSCGRCKKRWHLDCCELPPPPSALRLNKREQLVDAGRWFCMFCRDMRCAACGSDTEPRELTCRICKSVFGTACGKQLQRVCVRESDSEFVCPTCDPRDCRVCGPKLRTPKTRYVHCRNCNKLFHGDCPFMVQGISPVDFARRAQSQAEGNCRYTLYDWVCEPCRSCNYCGMADSRDLLRCDTCDARIHPYCAPELPPPRFLTFATKARDLGLKLYRGWRCRACIATRCGLCTGEVLDAARQVTCRTCSWFFHIGCIKRTWGKEFERDCTIECKLCWVERVKAKRRASI